MNRLLTIRRTVQCNKNTSEMYHVGHVARGISHFILPLLKLELGSYWLNLKH